MHVCSHRGRLFDPGFHTFGGVLIDERSDHGGVVGRVPGFQGSNPLDQVIEEGLIDRFMGIDTLD